MIVFNCDDNQDGYCWSSKPLQWHVGTSFMHAGRHHLTLPFPTLFLPGLFAAGTDFLPEGSDGIFFVWELFVLPFLECPYNPLYMGIQLHPHPRKTWPPTMKIDSAAVGCSYVLILAFLLPGLYWVDFVEHRLSRNLRGTGHAWPESWICFFPKVDAGMKIEQAQCFWGKTVVYSYGFLYFFPTKQTQW